MPSNRKWSIEEKLERRFNLEPIEEYPWKSQAKKLENVIRNYVKF